MNHLAQQLLFAQTHATWRQRTRAIVLQIFGHEGLFDVDGLRKTSHCGTLNEEVYRLAPLRVRKDLALRKLLNPFKWVEFLIAYPLTMLAQQISPFDLYIVNTLANVATGIARRVLAPVRYIVRPTIELIQSSPALASYVIAGSLLVMGLLAATIFTGGASLLLGIAIACIWPTVLKLTTTAKEAADLYQRPKPDFSEQRTEMFMKGSTVKVSAALHAIDPVRTDVKHPTQQSVSYRLALFTGTESLFYSKSSKAALDPTCESVMVPCPDINEPEYQPAPDHARHQAATTRFRC